MSTDDIDNEDEQDANNDPKWWIDENTPGAGDRPDWLPEKFSSLKDVEQARANLEKKLGTVPGEYDFGEYKDKFDTEHEAFKQFKEFAKEKRIPQEAFTKMLESMNNYWESFAPNPDGEKQELGDDAEQRISTLRNWVQANFSDTAKQAVEKLTGEGLNASTVKALEEIRGKFMSDTPTVPNGSTNSDTGNLESMEDIQSELAKNMDKYENDSAYRKDIKNRISKIEKAKEQSLS